MDLQALADFNLVAAHGGFGKASRRSGRSKATLSRRVSELEQSLGVRLIERGTHTLRLTEEGRALHSRTEGPLAEITEAGEAVVMGASTPRGRLRISAPMVFAHVALGRIGARFALAYPEVQLEIVAEDRKVDPVEDGYDLVIRINPSPDEQRLVGRRFLYDRLLLVAPPTLPRPTAGKGPAARRAGAKDAATKDAATKNAATKDVATKGIATNSQLPVKAVVLTNTPADATWRVLTEDNRKLTITPTPILRLSSLLLVRDAVLAGAGVGLLPQLLVADDVAAGRLTQWGIEDGPAVEIWALQSSRRLVGAKVRAFLEVMEKTYPEKVFVRNDAPS